VVAFPLRSRRSAPRAEILEFVSADRLNLPRPFRQNGYSRVTVSEKRRTKTQLEAVSGLGYLTLGISLIPGEAITGLVED
jgi:hypothetical protein